MKYPSLQEERKLWEKGYKRVVGLDEVGRGALAGPVVAVAAVVINPKYEYRNPKPRRSRLAATLRGRQILNSKFKCSKYVLNFGHLDFDIVSNFVLRVSNLGLRDSKKLSPKQREEFYKLIIRSPVIEWGLGRVSEKVIDKINILEATKLAMKKAIENLMKKAIKNQNKKLLLPHSHQTHDRTPDVNECFLILDGKMKLNLPIPQKSIIKADEKVFSCACASILAKVWRDKIMERYHKKYPQYGFDKHKGYLVKYHKKMLKKFGPCKIHRKSFALGSN